MQLSPKDTTLELGHCKILRDKDGVAGFVYVQLSGYDMIKLARDILIMVTERHGHEYEIAVNLDAKVILIQEPAY